jgi:sterol 3beta-glucosyltransferase
MGAGPRPIPHRTLNSQNLAAAIEYCLTPQAQQAAQGIAAQMHRESGVATAVDSFHRQLVPTHVTCDILPRHTAQWVYNSRKSAAHVKLSDAALKILIQQKRLKFSDVEM